MVALKNIGLLATVLLANATEGRFHLREFLLKPFLPSPPRLVLRTTRYHDQKCTTGQELDRFGPMGHPVAEGRCWSPKDRNTFGSLSVYLDQEDVGNKAMLQYGHCGIKVWQKKRCHGEIAGIVPNVNDRSRSGVCGNAGDKQFPPLYSNGVSLKLVCKKDPWELKFQKKLSKHRLELSPTVNEWGTALPQVNATNVVEAVPNPVYYEAGQGNNAGDLADSDDSDDIEDFEDFDDATDVDDCDDCDDLDSVDDVDESVGPMGPEDAAGSDNPVGENAQSV